MSIHVSRHYFPKLYYLDIITYLHYMHYLILHKIYNVNIFFWKFHQLSVYPCLMPWQRYLVWWHPILTVICMVIFPTRRGKYNIKTFKSNNILEHDWIMTHNHGEKLSCPTSRAVSFHPVPRAMATVVFWSRKKLMKYFSLNATGLLSKTKKWKTWKTDKSYLCLPQLVKRGCFNTMTFFLVNSWLLKKGVST